MCDMVMIEIAEKICTALEEKELWGIHKDAEHLKKLIKEQYAQSKPSMQAPVDSHTMEREEGTQGSRIDNVSAMLQDTELDIGC